MGEMAESTSQSAKAYTLQRAKRTNWCHYLRELISTNLENNQSTIILEAFATIQCNNEHNWSNDLGHNDNSVATLRVVVDELIKKKRLNIRFDSTRLQDFKPKSVDILSGADAVDTSNLQHKAITMYCLSAKTDDCFALFQTVCRIFACYEIPSFYKNAQGKVLSLSCYDTHFPIILHIILTELYDFPVPESSERTRAIALIDPSKAARMPMSKIADLMKNQFEVFMNFPLWFVRNLVKRFPTIVLEIHGLNLPTDVATKDKTMISEYVFNMVSFNSYGKHKTVDEVLLKNYERSLQNRSQDIYVIGYDIMDDQTQTKIHIFHVMRNLLNFRKMKEEVTKSKPDRDPELSNISFIRNGKRQYLNCGIDNTNLAAEIFEQFQGKSVHVREIENYIWLQTPFIFRKSALALMETESIPRILKVQNKFGIDSRSKEGVYPDGDLTVTFRTFSMDEAFGQLRS